MFIATAVQLTPENVETLGPLLAELGLLPDQAETLKQMLALRQLKNGPSIAEIATTTNLAAQTARRLDAATRLSAETNPYKSAFISYGGPDGRFASKLYAALMERGVHAYYFPESSTPGRRLHRTMSDAIHEYDVVISVCSEAAVTRPGWLNELQQTLAREAREGGSELLIPVLLDDYVLREWAPNRQDLARQLHDRVAGDFRGANDDLEFGRQLDRLVNALRAEAPC
jgi:hypothetical protein